MGSQGAQSPAAVIEDSVCSGESPVAERLPGWARGAPGSRRLRTRAGQLRLPPAAACAAATAGGTVPLSTPLPRTLLGEDQGVLPEPSSSLLFAPNMRSASAWKAKGSGGKAFQTQEQTRHSESTALAESLRRSCFIPKLASWQTSSRSQHPAPLRSF